MPGFFIVKSWSAPATTASPDGSGILRAAALMAARRYSDSGTCAGNNALSRPLLRKINNRQGKRCGIAHGSGNV
ncbi:hypothetical protein CHU92_06785 [Flavobacterium cyanobacteriorum]|uniref:Uncharacterized protein n=1 Tax=Flavobacterium cyanobacteriorum TaxID=2022802 RepID=A0A255ZBR8_9FLAO|nr:hypothetical protein [Flavobacterium cyanobacteriorum]OYQ38050.1 hypothetical protein CHU92_06785 [Flavobacterium cyanobacteriorum]